jgi:hypothetical protein
MSRTRVRTPLRPEPLEGRDAPATLAGPDTLTYRDVDGDAVTVTLSRPLLTRANVNTVFAFNAGGVDGANATGQQLRRIDLAALGPAAAHTSVTVNATPRPGGSGDGLAAVGEVLATGIDLGAVTIDGDLGRVVAGDGTVTTRGLAGLAVQSLGRFGTATGAADLSSAIQGGLGFLRVKGDVTGASVEVRGELAGSIGSMSVGGSLVGGAAPYSGYVLATGYLGVLTVGGDVVGGAGDYSGLVLVGASIRGGVTVGGSVRGGAGRDSGEVYASGELGPTAVGGDVAGGAGYNSGRVYAGARMRAGVSVRGSVRGGAGDSSGQITAGNFLGTAAIGGDVAGGAGESSGRVGAANWMTDVTVGGSVRGGAGLASGLVVATKFDTLTVRGDVVGGAGPSSGGLSAFVVSRALIGGSLIGGAGDHSGRVGASWSLGAITVGGDIVGGSASGSVELTESGCVHARQIARVTLGGSLVAGTDDTTGFFRDNGVIRADYNLGTVLVKGSLLGNPTNPAVITARGQRAPVGTADVAIGRLTVLGRAEYARILAGVDDDFWVRSDSDAQVGPVSIGGDWVASSLAAGVAAGADGLFGTADDAKLVGSGIPDDPRRVARIASLTIGGQALGTPAGVSAADHYGIVAEAIGGVRVGGVPAPRKPGPHNDAVALGITGDLTIREA